VEPAAKMARKPINDKRSAEQLLELSEKLGAGFRHATGSGVIDVDPTPRKAICGDGNWILYHYDQPTKTRASTTPLLIVYALVNRPYMMDLEPGRSVISVLVERGVDTYLLDWGYPDAANQFHSLEDYLFTDLHSVIDVICERHNLEQINVLGVCQGGVFSLCYTAAHPHRVRNLVTMVTPVDFHTPDNLISRWIRTLDLDNMVETLGNVPGELLNFGFLALKPFALGAHKYMEMIDNADNAERLATFLRMERWIGDCPDQAGVAFTEFVRSFFIDNGLVQDSVRIGDVPISLSRINQPILNIIAQRDHLVPPSACTALKSLTRSTDYVEHFEDAGHIGLFVGARTSRNVATTIADWLAAHEQHR
jgi:polyhydroxyalkanoate synthase subunit PhaC